MQLKFLLGLLILIVTPQLSLSAACFAQNCTQCTISDANACIQCNNGYTLSNSRCYANPTDNCKVKYCTQCESGNNSKCRICESFYKISNFFTCIPISCYQSECALCPEDRYVCKRCQLGYYANFWDNCVSKCQSSACATCQFDKVSNENRCVTCKEGYKLQGIIFLIIFSWRIL